MQLNSQLDASEREPVLASAAAESTPSPVFSTITLVHTRFWTVLMAIIALGSLVRVWAVFQYSPLEVLTTDPGRWWEEATHLSTFQPIAGIDAFGYPLWLGLFIKLTGGGALAIALHNAALSVVTPWIWHRLVRALSGSKQVALASWAVFCWVPSWISIFSYTMSETLFLPLLGLALWVTVAAHKERSRRAYFASALLWALATATRVYALPLALILLLWSCRPPKQISKLCYGVLAFALVGTPLAIRSHSILNVWRPFGLPTMNEIYMESSKRTLRFDISRDNASYRWTYEFGSPSLYQEPLAPFSRWKSTRDGIAYFAIRQDHGTADWNRALHNYRPSWDERFRLWGENLIFFNFAPSWPDNNPDRVADRAAVTSRWCWLPLAIVITVWNIRYRARWNDGMAAAVALLTTLAWWLTPLLPAVMEGRYRKPVEGLLIVNLFLLLHIRRLLGAPISGGRPVI